MKIMIKTKVIPYLLFICLVFLVWHQFFLVFDFPDRIDEILKSDNLILLVATASFAVFVFSLFFKKNTIMIYHEYVNYILGLLVSIFILIVYSLIKYPEQSFIVTVKDASICIFPIFSIVVIWYLEKGGSISSVLKCMNFFAVLWYILVIVEVYWFDRYGHFLMNFKEYFLEHYNEGDLGLRINLHVFGNVMILYNLISLRYSKTIKEKIVYLSSFLLGGYSLIVIQQTRAVLFYLLICIATWIFIFSDKSIKTRIIQLIIVIFSGYVICFTDVLESFWQSFSTKGENAISTTARLYALDYYLQCFFDNILLGNGFADGAKNSIYSSVEHGARGIAYYGDMGIIGSLANIGLVVVVTFIIPVVRMIKCWQRTTKLLDNKNRSILLAFIVFFIVSMPTYFVMHGRNVLLFAIVLGIFEYINVRVNELK